MAIKKAPMQLCSRIIVSGRSSKSPAPPIILTLSLLLLTGSNFSDFAILFTFRLAILDFNHKTH